MIALFTSAMIWTYLGVALLWATPVASTKFMKEDKVCDPGENNLIFPFTGYRLQRQFTVGIPVLHHMRLTHCDHGYVDMDAFVPVDRNTDLQWATDICVSYSQCYRAVRSKEFALRKMDIYAPFARIGGLFQCPGNDTACTNENAIPLLPLLADRTYNKWYELPLWRRIILRVPIATTPNFIDPRFPHRKDYGNVWAEKLDINENYKYSPWEKLQLKAMVAWVVNRFHDVFTINPRRLFWERDSLEKALSKDERNSTFSRFLEVTDFVTIRDLLANAEARELEEVSTLAQGVH